jgi:hypothetical protein
MAQCLYCREETSLYINGVAICLSCDNNQVRTRLTHDLADATLQADAAAEALKGIMNDIPSGLPHPDGIQQIKNVSLELSKARDEMVKAHNRLDDYERDGIVPDDLKQDE